LCFSLILVLPYEILQRPNAYVSIFIRITYHNYRQDRAIDLHGKIRT